MVKYINQLPDDIFDIIFKYLNKYKINNIIIRHLLNNNNNKINIEIIAINRIKLFYILRKKYKIIKNYILCDLHKIMKNFYLPNSYDDNNKIFECIFKNISNNKIKIYNNKCVFYCSQLINGKCRFCSKKKDEHYFKSNLIVKYYYPMIDHLYISINHFDC